MSRPASKFEDKIDDKDHNKMTVLCQYCNSVILLPSKGKHVSIEKKLPFMTHKKESVASDGEDLSEFWFVDDMFVFENVGFTHSVNDIKYLSCADCEMGPIGFHIISTKENYVALARIKHGED